MRIGFTRLLGFKLFLIVAVVMLVSTLIFSTLTIQWHSDQYMRTAIATVSQVSDIIRRSTHYSMLLNRREDLDQIIRTVGNEPGIEVVRIYNKKGVITFSSNVDEIGAVTNFSDPACNACHTDDATTVSPASSNLTRIFHSARSYRVIGQITPIKNELSCVGGLCHAHPEAQTVLGVLDVMMPLQKFDESMAELKTVQYSNALILALTVTGVSGIFIWLMVNIPVKKLIRGTEEIRKGNLNYTIHLTSNDEIGRLAASFNAMTENLRQAHQELRQWAQTLEERVREKTDELRRTHASMVHVEKMASLGALAAAVAHELNNPLAGVLTYAKLLKRRVRQSTLEEEVKQEVENELVIITDEIARCGNIVKNLLLFSRQHVGEFKEVDLLQVLARSFKLIEHMLAINNVKLEQRASIQSPLLPADASQLEQAFLALAINAVEAMPEGGSLRVDVSEEEDGFRITFSDTGVGIAEEDLPRIFEPFYTTKHERKGTGLGLTVAYGIVERHGGSIQVQSRPHEGTTFTITLPRHAVQPRKAGLSTTTMTV